MKFQRAMALVLSLAMLAGLTACGGSSSSAPAAPDQSGAPAAPQNASVSIGTASLGGNFFTMGAAMAAVIIDDTGYKAVAQATGGSAANLDSIHNKELDVAICQAMSVNSAVQGTEQFAGAPLDDVVTLVNYSATPIHFLARRSQNIKGVADFKGKKIECLSPGDGVELATLKLLPLYDLSAEDVKLEYSGNRVQSASRLKTGQLDAMLDATGVGATWMADVIGDGKDYELLSFTEEEITDMTSRFPEFSRMVIPAGTYNGQTEDVITVGFWTVVVASKDMDEEVAYNITKAVYDNKEDLIKAHSFFKDLAPENALSGLAAPLHPGAERYYREVGAIQ